MAVEVTLTFEINPLVVVALSENKGLAKAVQDGLGRVKPASANSASLEVLVHAIHKDVYGNSYNLPTSEAEFLETFASRTVFWPRDLGLGTPTVASKPASKSSKLAVSTACLLLSMPSTRST